MDPSTLYLYVDGGVVGGNPGSAIYWSVGVDIAKDDSRVVVYAQNPRYKTNNPAEYMALIDGLTQAALFINPATAPLTRLSEIEELAGKEYTKVRVHSDSQLIVNQFNLRWQVKDKALDALWEKARKIGDHLEEQGVEVEVVWVPRKENVRRLGH
jgi:ribonuclease HI